MTKQLFTHTHTNGDIWEGYVENEVLKITIKPKIQQFEYNVLGIVLNDPKMYRVGYVKGVQTDEFGQIRDESLKF